MATEPPKVPPSPWQSPKFTGEPWWSKDTIVLVTGSNRGIGFGLIRALAKYGFTCIMTDKDDTGSSIAALKAEGLGDLVFAHTLDVTSSDSVADLATWVKEKFGGIDILVNNAGVWQRNVSYEDAALTLKVNYFGTTTVTKGLLPLIKPGGRILNITSRTGFYQRLKKEKVREQLGDLEHLTVEILDAIANEYLEDSKKGKLGEDGWVAAEGLAPQYSESKMLLNAYTLVLAKSLQTENPADQKVYACAVCPGFTETELVKGRELGGLQPGPLEVGLDSPLWLALLPKEEFAKKHEKLVAERVEYPYTWVPWIDPFAPPPATH